MKPEWVIYKNDERIGQSVTWHGALDVLVKQEGLTEMHVSKLNAVVFVYFQIESEFNTIYKIVKER